jgi:hypothetical protein
MEATRPSEYRPNALCVILGMLLVPQSHSTDLAPELISLGGALLTDSTQERHAEIHIWQIRIFFGGNLFRAKYCVLSRAYVILIPSETKRHKYNFSWIKVLKPQEGRSQDERNQQGKTLGRRSILCTIAT